MYVEGRAVSLSRESIATTISVVFMKENGLCTAGRLMLFPCFSKAELLPKDGYFLPTERHVKVTRLWLK